MNLEQLRLVALLRLVSTRMDAEQTRKRQRLAHVLRVVVLVLIILVLFVVVSLIGGDRP